jgi:hypothetical protein
MRFFLSLSALCVGGALGCGPGEYVAVRGTTQPCKPCPAGTFMDLQAHSERACRPCGSAMYQPKPGQAICLEALCDRYYAWSKTDEKCVLRHKYLNYLTAVMWPTFVTNFGMKCYSAFSWYDYFFIYNIFVCIGVGAETTRIRGGLISDGSFYTMAGFLSIGTLALGVNLCGALREGVLHLKRRRTAVTELRKQAEMHAVV